MKFRSVLLFSLFSLLVIASSTRAEEPVSWEPAVDMDGQIFPSLVIATHGVDFAGEEEDPYFLGDNGGYFGVTIQSPGAGARVSLTVSCDAIMKPSTLEATLDEADAEYHLAPIIDWDFETLHATNQAKPLVVRYELKVNGKSAGQRQVKAYLRSVNDCPFAVVDEEAGEVTDTSWMFAAYVNEDHPWIDEMLAETLETGHVSSFDGYQSGDQLAVLMQVFAIWNTLRNQGIRYSSITAAVGSNRAVYSQEVRFLDESVGNAQANCVDGSVLMASFLRKVDVAPVLVMVPGHCFLGFYLDEEKTALIGLETTMMGSDDIDADAVANVLPEDVEVSDELASDPGWINFLAALQAGTSQLEENAEAFADPDNPNYLVIDIAEAREMGIMPIAHVER